MRFQPLELDSSQLELTVWNGGSGGPPARSVAAKLLPNSDPAVRI